MFQFLIPLLLGFALNSASAFTAYFSHRLGERNGRLATIILRDLLGIPGWVVGYLMAARVDSPNLFDPITISSTLGWLVILAGAAIILVGMLSLGWRAAAPSMQDSLVRRGIYAHIRHPLYTGMLLELAGLFLWVPKLSVLVACCLGAAWILVQARLEELDLVQRLPAYKDYMRRVPRFMPRLH